MIFENTICYKKGFNLFRLNNLQYGDIVASAVNHFLLHKRELDKSIHAIYWMTVFKHLVSPATHKEVLDVLKMKNFIKNSSLDIIEGFFLEIKEQRKMWGPVSFLTYLESKNTDQKYYKKNYIFDILQYLEIPKKKAMILANIVIDRNNFKKMELYLSALYNRKIKNKKKQK